MTSGILLLNANMQPLKVVSLQKAVSLLSKDRVDVIETVPGRKLRSPSVTIDMPSVLRLRYYAHVPQRNAVWSRRAVFSRDNYTCVYCGVHLTRETATVDHLIPQEVCRKQGIRASTWTNTVTACETCNRRKANKTMRDAGMKFIDPNYIPKIPRVNYVVVTGEAPDSWRAYLRI